MVNETAVGNRHTAVASDHPRAIMTDDASSVPGYRGTGARRDYRETGRDGPTWARLIEWGVAGPVRCRDAGSDAKPIE
jgi:hypothetical protein